jgi:nucleoside-diphosphate-sugar epimerase
LWPVLLLRAGRFALVDGGEGIISPVHVDDIVTATLSVVDAPAVDRGKPGAVVGEVLHVTSGEAVTAAEFFGCYARMLGVDPPRSVPSRLVAAVDGLERIRAIRDRRRHHASPPSRSGAERNTRPVPGLVRGLGGRLAAGMHPRTHLDLGPLTVRELTRPGTFAIDKIGDVTGWRPKVGLADGMARTEHWLRERGLLGVREPTRRG